jgi:hypothetical protein
MKLLIFQNDSLSETDVLGCFTALPAPLIEPPGGPPCTPPPACSPEPEPNTVLAEKLNFPFPNGVLLNEALAEPKPLLRVPKLF